MSKKTTYTKEEDKKVADKGGRRNFKNSRNSRGRNDASWYTGNSQLAKDAGNFSFTWPVGSPVDLEFNKSVVNLPTISSHVQGDFDTFRLPGVMTLEFTPMAGQSKDNSSVLNVAAHNIYTFVRHANSGHSNYDAPDLMLYLLQMDQIYMMYSHLVRAYGCLSLYSQRNRNLPRVLIEAMGFDFDDMIVHMSDFRYYINNIALKINAFAVPSTMAYFTRHYWMCQNVYKDADDPKAQLYVFVPHAYGTYNEVSGAGQIDVNFWRLNGNKTFAQVRTIMDTMLNAVMYSEDMNIMSGDILKAYGENSLFAVPQISADYIVVPTYNLEVLGQIHNITLCGNAAFTNGTMFSQDTNTGALISTVHFSKSMGICTSNKIIMSAFSMSPTEDEVLVNSRLAVRGEYTIANSASSPSQFSVRVEPTACGSEVVGCARVYFMLPNSTVAYWYFEESMAFLHNTAYNGTGATFNPLYSLGDNVTSYWGARGILSAFNFHPLIYWEQIVQTGTYGDYTKITDDIVEIDFDVDNYAILDAHDLEKMHETSLLSLFNVPQMGR